MSKLEELYSRHDSIPTDHERHNYGYLKRKQKLKSLGVAHDELWMENDSLLAQQISASHEEFVPPCLKFLEHENVDSFSRTLNTSENIASTANVVTNPSSE